MYKLDITKLCVNVAFTINCGNETLINVYEELPKMFETPHIRKWHKRYNLGYQVWYPVYITIDIKQINNRDLILVTNVERWYPNENEDLDLDMYYMFNKNVVQSEIAKGRGTLMLEHETNWEEYFNVNVNYENEVIDEC